MFKVVIITPEKRAFDGEARFVEFRTIEGAMGTLQKRSPLLAAMAISELELEDGNGGKQTFAVHGGIAEFSNNTFMVLSDAAEKSEEIDVERARRALEQAKVELEGTENEIQRRQAEGKVQRALTRLKVANKK